MSDFPMVPPGELALRAEQAADAWKLLCRLDARDCAEAVGLAPYWGKDTSDASGDRGARRPVLRDAQFEKET